MHFRKLDLVCLHVSYNSLNGFVTLYARFQSEHREKIVIYKKKDFGFFLSHEFGMQTVRIMNEFVVTRKTVVS